MAYKTVYSKRPWCALWKKNGWIKLLQSVIFADSAKSKIIWSLFSVSLFCLSWHIWLTVGLIWLADLFIYENNQICSLIQTKTLQRGEIQTVYTYTDRWRCWNRMPRKKFLDQIQINLNLPYPPIGLSRMLKLPLLLLNQCPSLMTWLWPWLCPNASRCPRQWSKTQTHTIVKWPIETTRWPIEIWNGLLSCHQEGPCAHWSISPSRSLYWASKVA